MEHGDQNELTAYINDASCDVNDYDYPVRLT